MRRKSTKEFIALGIFKGLIILGILLFFAVFSISGASAKEGNPSEITNCGYAFEELNPDEVTTEWSDSYLFSTREEYPGRA